MGLKLRNTSNKIFEEWALDRISNHQNISSKVIMAANSYGDLPHGLLGTP
jgi:hypothetical protein